AGPRHDRRVSRGVARAEAPPALGLRRPRVAAPARRHHPVGGDGEAGSEAGPRLNSASSDLSSSVVVVTRRPPVKRMSSVTSATTQGGGSNATISSSLSNSNLAL